MIIVNWNVEWATRRARRGNIILNRLFECHPEVICLTEAYLDFLPDNGSIISSAADYGYPIVEGRRKVILWSKNTWNAVSQELHPNSPTGRYVFGETDTSIGKMGIHGVCIPWADAHVRTGKKNREKWEDHLNFLEGLDNTLKNHSPDPQIITGDFNQRMPRKRVPIQVYERLINLLEGRFKITTTGIIDGVSKQTIDHIGCNKQLAANRIFALSNIGENGQLLSDHFGIVADLARN